jgi:hypothetical protein
MLWNPQWELSQYLAKFIAWLETKDPNETYNFTLSRRCALAQFVESIAGAIKQPYMGGSMAYIINGQTVDFRPWLDAVAFYGKPRTFGNALAKARKLQELEVCC